MIKNPLPGFGSGTGNHVQHACRQHIGNQSDQFHERQRRMGRRLDNDRIACRQRRSKLPAGHEEWEIPGNNLSDHTDRFMNHKRHRIVVKHRRRAFLRTDASCEITEMVSPHRNIHRAGFTNRLTVVQRFDKSQMLSILINNIRNLQEIILSFNGRSPAPGFQGAPSGFHRQIHIFPGRFRKRRKHFSVGGIVGFKSFAVRGGHKFAVNEKIIPFLNVCHK